MSTIITLKRLFKTSINIAGIAFTFFLTSLISYAQTEDYTYSLTQSNNDYSLWTSTPSTRIFKVQDAPAGTGSDIKVY